MCIHMDPGVYIVLRMATQPRRTLSLFRARIQLRAPLTVCARIQLYLHARGKLMDEKPGSRAQGTNTNGRRPGPPGDRTEGH